MVISTICVFPPYQKLEEAPCDNPDAPAFVACNGVKKKKKKKKKVTKEVHQGDSEEAEDEANDIEELGPECDSKINGESKSETPVETDTVSFVDCPTCKKRIPKSNYELHELRCRKNPPPPPPKSAAHVTPGQNGVSSKSAKSKSKQQKDLLRETATDDFDELLRLADKMNNVCNQKGCKTNIHVLGQECDFCNHRFCLHHHMPEIHGCGDAARAKAKKNSIKVSKYMLAHLTGRMDGHCLARCVNNYIAVPSRIHP